MDQKGLMGWSMTSVRLSVCPFSILDVNRICIAAMVNSIMIFGSTKFFSESGYNSQEAGISCKCVQKGLNEAVYIYIWVDQLVYKSEYPFKLYLRYLKNGVLELKLPLTVILNDTRNSSQYHFNFQHLPR